MKSLTIDDTGVKLQTFQEIREALRTEWQETFGVTIDLSASSIDGHHIDLESKTITSVSQLAAVIVSNLNVDTAEGVWLDILADYKGMSRLKASYSIANVVFEGEPNVVIPNGTIVKYDGSVCNFVLESSVTIGNDGFVVGKCKAVSIGKVDIYVGKWAMVSSTPSNVNCRVFDGSGVGSNDETDEELRIRYKNKKGDGLATYDKMVTYLESVLGANTFELEDNGPIELTVYSGYADNNTVAQALWDCKPAGKKTNGNTSGEAYDIKGKRRTLYFSRPVKLNLWVKVRLTEYAEETIPTDYSDRVSNAIVEWSKNEYRPGKDVLPKRLYTPIFSVEGIKDAEILVCISEEEPVETAYVDHEIAVGSFEYAEVKNVIVELA